MNLVNALDDGLLRRLPLPLAQLYLRAHNAKTPIERQLTAYYLWEASLKLLGAVAIVTYADLGRHDPQIVERLRSLARPSLGHWWEFVRSLVPILAEAGDDGFRAAADLLLGPGRSDLPRTAGLDVCLREALDGRAGARATVRLGELFDRLVRYRNRELGHGAAGQAAPAQYERVGASLLLGVTELLGRLDVLAGRRLAYVADVRRQASGDWLVEPYELTGETARRLPSRTVPAAEALRLPRPERVYLELPGGDGPGALCSLHPLVTFDLSGAAVFFLNSRRGARRSEYLCYTTGEHRERDEAGPEERELLARALGRPVGSDEIDANAVPPQPEEPPPPGAAGEARRRFGEFELLSELGRGGMGVVYRAWQPSLGRTVALKCLLRAGDPKAEARFAREIHALGRVEHPNVVKVFTSGVDGEHWYYAMELVEGADLGAVCDRLGGSSASAVTEADWRGAVSTACEEARKKERPLSDDGSRPAASPPGAAVAPPPELTARGGRAYVAQVVELMRQVAEGAHALHEAGVVHRDVKPGNILLAPDGEHAILMDLGLAQLADETEGRLTRTRQFVGTLRYASPEQVLAAGTVDRRSDVYSLGATLWEALALRPVYAATEQTPTPELMRRIQYEEPARLRALNPQVPRDLEAVVRKCLEKDAARRYATAHDLAADLARWAGGKPVLAQPPTLRYLLGKYVRRHWLGVAATAAVALALLLSVAGAVYRINAARVVAEAEKDRTKEALSREEIARADAEHQRAEADSQRAEADGQRRRAEEREAVARRRLYASEIHLAQEAWRNGEPGRTLELLDSDSWKPTPTDPEDLRGWEWYYLRGLCNASFRTLTGHTNGVSSVAYGPDGRKLVSSGLDGTIKVWDPATARLLATLLPQTPFAGIGIHFKRTESGEAVINIIYGGGSAAVDRRLGPGDKLLKISGPDGTMVDLSGLKSAAISQLLRGADGSEIRLEVLPAGRQEPQTYALTRHPVRHAVSSVAVSPDGRQLASGGEAGELRIWDLGTGQEVRRLLGHTDLVRSVVFSPDGRRLASLSSDDGTVKVWDVDGGRVVHSMPTVADGQERNVAISPDGRWLAAAVPSLPQKPKGDVALWEVTSGKEVRRLPGQGIDVSGIAFSPDGRFLASVAGDLMIRLWDPATGRQVRAIPNQVLSVQEGIFSPDSRWFAQPNLNGSVSLWDVETGQELRNLRGHTSLVSGLAFSPDGRQLASAGADHTIKLWTLGPAASAATREARILNEGAPVLGLTFSPDGKDLVATSTRIGVWDGLGEEVTRSFGVAANGVAFSPDGRLMALNEIDGTVKAIDAADGHDVRHFEGSTEAWTRVSLDAGGRLLAAAVRDGGARLWDFASGKELHTFHHTRTVTCMALSRDGRYAASCSLDGTTKLWDTASGQVLYNLNAIGDIPFRLAFRPDGRGLALGCGSGKVGFWDLGEGRRPRLFPGHVATVSDLAFSPDGRRLVTASHDGTVKVWDSATGQELLTLRGHTGVVWAVAFSPDGWRLASAGPDQTIRLWDAALLALEPKDLSAVLCGRRAFLESAMGRAPEAIADFSLALDKGIDNPLVWRYRGACQAYLGRWDEAVADYTKTLELRPEDWMTCYLRGVAHAERKRWDKALPDFTRAEKLHPEDALTGYTLALVQLAQGDATAYRQTCARLLERFVRAKDENAVNSACWACALAPNAVADLAGAVRAMEKLMPREAVSQYAIRSTLGTLLYRAGRDDEAIKRLEEAIKINGQGGTAYDHLFLAMAHQRLGHKEQAQKELALAVAWIERMAPEKPGKAPAGTALTWEQRLELQLLRREAESAVKPAAP